MITLDELEDLFESGNYSISITEISDICNDNDPWINEPKNYDFKKMKKAELKSLLGDEGLTGYVINTYKIDLPVGVITVEVSNECHIDTDGISLTPEDSPDSDGFDIYCSFDLEDNYEYNLKLQSHRAYPEPVKTTKSQLSDLLKNYIDVIISEVPEWISELTQQIDKKFK